MKRNYTFAIVLLLSITSAIIDSSFVSMFSFVVMSILVIINAIKKNITNIINISILLLPCFGLLLFNSFPLHYLLYIICIFAIIFSNKKIKIPKKSILYFCAIICLDFIRFLIIKGEYEIDITSILNVAVLYLMAFYAMIIYYYLKQEKAEQTLAMNSFIMGTICSIIFGFVYRFVNYGIQNTIFSSSLALRNAGASLDPNYYSFYIILSISFILVKYVVLKEYKIKNLLLVALLLISGLSSISRMYYILCIPILLVSLIIALKTIATKYRYKILIIICLVLVLIPLIGNRMLGGIKLIESRLNPNASVDITNGRAGLINQYGDILNNRSEILIFGAGIPKYYKRLGMPLYAHNLYMEILVCEGTIGMVVGFIFLLKFIRDNKSNTNRIRYLPLLISLMAGLALSFIDAEGFYLIFSVILGSICNYNEAMS